MNVSFLGLGGNMGDRPENLRSALALIEQECGAITALSPVYETEAWGSDSKNNYLNQVVKLNTALSLDALLEKVLDIERKLGRTRNGEQNSDRTVDIDILFFNALVTETQHVLVPHPRLHLRKFVLVPLNDLAPELVHPVLKKNITELLAACEDTLEVRRV